MIAAITSCTNTSNPAGMVAAGLVARRAVQRGLRPRPWVKTSLAPGSRVVAEYLRATGLQDDLDALGFNVIGFGCTTCNGMSGPLAGPIRAAIEEHGLVCAAVLSGNRNFEARIHPHCRANYLASAPLVVAYAIAGSMTIDVTTEPLAIMLPKNDPEFKKLVDEEMRRLIVSKEINAIYDKWFMQPIAPTHRALNLPVSYLLRDFWKYPTDQVPF